MDNRNDASIGSSSCTLVNSSFTNHCTQLTNCNLWTLYFYISRNTQGVDVGFLLVGLCGIQTYFSHHLESKCTNNDVEYKALIQGLGKEINLNVKGIEVFGDSWLVIKQVRNSIFSTFYHLSNYHQEVWSLINKFDSFKFILHTKNFDTSMLIDEATNLNLYHGSIDKKFYVQICRPLIPSTDWRNSNDDQHISKVSIVNEEQNESFLQDPVSDEKPELGDLLSNHIIKLESHFGLQGTYKGTMNGSSQQKFRNLYSSPKPVDNMKPNKLLAA